MLRPLLRCKWRSSGILHQETLNPLIKQNIFTSSFKLVRGSREQITNVEVSSPQKESSSESTVGEEQKQYAGESPQALLSNALTANKPAPLVPDNIWHEGPYPHKSSYQKSQAKHSVRPNIDPRETSVIFFPGQGTQYVGMGKDLLKYPNVQEMYDAASQILGYDLLKLSLEGPADKLNKTVYQQPAVVVASLAAVEKLREEKPKVLETCVAVAGFSVGEITALTFAGAFAFEDAIKLVKVRAEAMQLASEITPSGMMSVLYGPDSRLGFACSVAKELCQRKGLVDFDCRIASYLYPHCKIIAGNDEALSFIASNKANFRLKRLKRLPVSGAFHTDLMRPAAEPVRKALEKMDIDPPIIPVHSNVDGKPYKNVKHIAKQLPKQIYSSVKWEQTMHILYERTQGVAFPNTFECGPGNSLRTILKMCNAKAIDFCTSVNA